MRSTRLAGCPLRLEAALLAASAALAVCCSINPATGERQLFLVSEGDEIALGRQADPEIVAQFGLYPDERVQEYVNGLGQALAARSERPDLPWIFRVLDDPLVNAFALPGGFIYVTRGIMTHLGSEAELVGVLGHEIGHVTARHGASQMSRAMLAQLGLGLGMVLAPEAAQQFGGLAQQGLGLLFLKYGRDDERQADSLGLRYTLQLGYAGEEMVEVFDVLERVSRAGGGGELPTWLSTHPAPENRAERLRQQIAAAPAGEDLLVRREAYFERIDGMVYGADPRHGYFFENAFYHPDLRFRYEVPSDWTRTNTRQAVSLLSPGRDAVIQLTLAEEPTAVEAATKFFSQGSVVTLGEWVREVADLPAASAFFEVRDDAGVLQLEGLALFVEYGGNVYRLLGYTRAGSLSRFGATFRHTLASFAPLTERRFLEVSPMRIEIVRLRDAKRVGELDSTLDADSLALLNDAEVDTLLPSGTLAKTVVGGLQEAGLR